MIFVYNSVEQKSCIILQRVESLLCNNREIRKYIRAVSRQRLGRHVPAATDTHATMVQQHKKCVFYVVTQRRGKHISAATNPDTIEELCFLCGPCRDCTTGTVLGN
jgi:hypothetical protein